MRSYLLILLCSLIAPLQCQISSRLKMNSFFVSRREPKLAICIEPNSNFYSAVYPTFDLDKLQFPPGVGFMHWDWLSDWKLQSVKDVRDFSEGSKLFVAAGHPFQLLKRINKDTLREPFYILASNISLWLVEQKPRSERGLLIELDHWNETTGLKDTTMKYTAFKIQKKKK